jgi:hypothetical protein
MPADQLVERLPTAADRFPHHTFVVHATTRFTKHRAEGISIRLDHQHAVISCVILA